MTSGGRRPGPVREAAGLLYAAMHVRRGGMVRPIDAPLVRATQGSGEPLRLLFVANGLAHGWGVASHRLAPTGALAKAVAAAADAPCEVEFVGDAAMTAETAALWLEGRADRSFHGAVVAIGSNDALRLTPPSEWQARLGELLDAVQRELPTGAPVVVLGIPDVVVSDRVSRMSPVFRRRARRLDRVTARLTGPRAALHFVPAPDLRGLAGGAPGEALYTAFAAAPATPMIELLHAATTGPTATPALERFERAEVRSIVEAGRADSLQALQAIIQRARTRFGVLESAVTLVDGDRTWHVAHSGKSPTQVPRSLTYCETVVSTDAPLVVEDSRRDPRFADNPFLGLQHARFYAGVPLHAADGTAIGALCLLHGFPRSAKRIDLAGLKSLALEAEAVLRDVAAARGPEVSAGH